MNTSKVIVKKMRVGGGADSAPTGINRVKKKIVFLSLVLFQTFCILRFLLQNFLWQLFLLDKFLVLTFQLLFQTKYISPQPM